MVSFTLDIVTFLLIYIHLQNMYRFKRVVMMGKRGIVIMG